MSEEKFIIGKQEEECGVFGIFGEGNIDVARITYHGLYALQHRGQESAGIAVVDEGTILHHKDMGLVSEIFNKVVIDHLKLTQWVMSDIRLPEPAKGKMHSPWS